VWRRPLAAFRASPTFDADPFAVATWLRLSELAASRIETTPYDAQLFKRAIHEVRGLADAAFESISAQLIDRCASAGVAVVFIKDVGKTRVSGAARWLTPAKAMISLSLRHQRDDHVWFSFFHEAGHVLLHSKKMLFVDLEEADSSDMEHEADTFAASLLIPQRHEPQLRRLLTEEDVRTFARELGVAPGIVVGRLHRTGFWNWKRGNRLRRGVRFGPQGVPESDYS
jgi:HTH-type transcriptional regulator/antitoxin HigA